MKKLIIDGHNLVPKIPGLHLKDEDDEVRLIELLQEYCRLARRQAELNPAPAIAKMVWFTSTISNWATLRMTPSSNMCAI